MIDSEERIDEPDLSALLCNFTWESKSFCDGEDTLFSVNIESVGRFTVLDRMTGFGGGQRDIESGFKDLDGKFWLASGAFDIREHKELSLADAISLIMKRANTCTGV